MKFKLHEFSNSTNWIKGTIGNYEFCAKHFDEGSRFGIDNGRVSKLEITKDNVVVVAYDRGWGIKPKEEEVIKAYDKLMKQLEHLPERFDAMELDIIETMEEENKWYRKLEVKVAEWANYIENWTER